MSTDFTPGPDLVRRVRIGFIQQDKTLSSWCTENGVQMSGARQVLIGSWNGPKGRALRERLLRASGVLPSAGRRHAA